MADTVIELLAEASTNPEGLGYMTQADLAAAINVRSGQAVNDVVTRAAIRVANSYPGYAIVHNRQEGYRMVDQTTIRDKRVELGRLRKARTTMSRAAVACGAVRNGPVSKMVSRQIETVVLTVIEPAIDTLLEEVAVGANQAN